jgi:hypothetical protein
MCSSLDAAGLFAEVDTHPFHEDDIVFETFQPGRLRKWSRGEMRTLPAVDIHDAVDSGRAVVVADFQSGDGETFRP